MKGIIKLSAANSSQDWDEVVLVDYFLLSTWRVQGMAKPLLLFQELLLEL